MIQEIVQFQEIDNLHTNNFASDHHQFHVIEVKILFLDIVTV